MAAAKKLGTQLPEVVDLAIQNDRNRAGLVEDRLITTRHVDDREALHSEADAVMYVDAPRIRSAMFHCRAHASEEVFSHRTGVVDLSRDSAHRYAGSPRG